MDLSHRFFDTKRGFYQFAAKENDEDNEWIQDFIVEKIEDGWSESEKILFIAARYGHLKVFEALLPRIEDKNPQLSHFIQPSTTTLHVATKNGHEKIVQFILDNLDIEDKNPPDEVGMTPLHIAVKEGFSNLVQILFHQAEDKSCND